MASRVTSTISAPTLLYAVGQGALAIEIRSNDDEVKSLVSKLTHHATDLTCRAERACLRVLEGGCSVPVGVNTSIDEEKGTLSLTGSVTSLTGQAHIQCSKTMDVRTPEEAEALGESVAQELLKNGAKPILEEIGKDREVRNAQAAKNQAEKLGDLPVITQKELEA